MTWPANKLPLLAHTDTLAIGVPKAGLEELKQTRFGRRALLDQLQKCSNCEELAAVAAAASREVVVAGNLHKSETCEWLSEIPSAYR